MLMQLGRTGEITKRVPAQFGRWLNGYYTGGFPGEIVCQGQGTQQGRPSKWWTVMQDIRFAWAWVRWWMSVIFSYWWRLNRAGYVVFYRWTGSRLYLECVWKRYYGLRVPALLLSRRRYLSRWVWCPDTNVWSTVGVPVPIKRPARILCPYIPIPLEFSYR